MTMRLASIFVAAALMPAAALAQGQAAGNDAAPSEAPSPDMQALIANCSAHKFETTIQVTVDGKTHPSKVKLCGKEGQSDADWTRTLEDAVAKVEANDKMPAEAKGQIVAAINAEIARLRSAIVASAPLVPRALPPERPPEYSVLPPLPTAPVTPPATVSSLAASPILAKPRLGIRCFTPGDLGDGPCNALERDTLLTVHADEALPDGISLRFMRKGDARGEVALAQMRKGQSRRFTLPPQVCSGVVGGRIEIQVINRGQVVDSLGPADLRC